MRDMRIGKQKKRATKYGWNLEDTQSMEMWGAWVAQLVKCLTLDLSSGHDLVVSRVRAPRGARAWYCTEPA